MLNSYSAYCKNYCYVLYQNLIHFKTLVYDKWNFNIEDYPTISSISFAIE
nr:DNA polymerase [Trametes maxima]